GRWLRASELVDDDVADEVAQGSRPSIMAIGSQKASAAQARDRHRVEQTVVGLRIEQTAGGDEIARSGRQTRNVEFGIGGAVDMAAAATDAGLPGGATEDRRRTEGRIPQ